MASGATCGWQNLALRVSRDAGESSHYIIDSIIETPPNLGIYASFLSPNRFRVTPRSNWGIFFLLITELQAFSAITVPANNCLLHKQDTRLLSKAKFIYATLINPHKTTMESMGQTGHISTWCKSASLHSDEGSHTNLHLLEEWTRQTW